MKKLLSFILSVCLILPCAFLVTGCKDKEPEVKMETWDGTVLEVSVDDADADGVITIDTAEELAGFAQAVNAGEDFAENTIRLACDMDMANRTWTPIGVGHRDSEKVALAKPFKGTFDGNNKKIIGLTNGDYTPTEDNQAEETEVFNTYHYGFFGFVRGATIKNLELTVNFNCNSANLKGDSVGGVVGYSGGALTVENCTVNGTINGGYDAVGGIVGRSYEAEGENSVLVKNCVNNAEVTGDSKVAGVVGYITSQLDYIATIDNCVNNGNIKSIGEMYGAKYFISVAAGVVNYGFYTKKTAKMTITNNVNNGNVAVCERVPSAEELDSRKPMLAYAYVATQTRNNLVETLHSYDFGSEEGTANSNTGKAYCEGNEKTALVVFAKQLEVKSGAETYLPENEANGTKFTATPVTE